MYVCFISLIQYSPDAVIDLVEDFPDPVDKLEVKFVPKDDVTDITIQGLVVEFCTHPSKFEIIYF